MERDYNTAQGATVLGARFSPGPRLGECAAQLDDLSSLRNQIAACVDRAQSAGVRVHDIGNQVFGARPEVADAKPAEDSISPPSLMQLVGAMDAALSRIETGLNRL